MASSYKKRLDECWTAHVQPREPMAPTVISLFAGCGGSSLGYSMAGFRELLAVEYDRDAATDFVANFPGVPVLQRDICSVGVSDVINATGIKCGELDVLDGSPPCQGFSVAGKKDPSDSRNTLFKEFVRLLVGLMPRAFVMENVPNMRSGRMRHLFSECMSELELAGYDVKADVLDAQMFGVPQKRQRLIFAGVRKDLRVSPSLPVGNGVRINVADAFIDIENNDYDGRAMTAKYLDYWEKAAPGRAVGKYMSNKKLDPSNPSFTLARSERNGGAYHYLNKRPITTSERKRLGSFPDQFVFRSWESAVCGIGNSVPPLLMKAISEHVQETVLNWRAPVLARGPIMADTAKA